MRYESPETTPGGGWGGKEEEGPPHPTFYFQKKRFSNLKVLILDFKLHVRTRARQRAQSNSPRLLPSLWSSSTISHHFGDACIAIILCKRAARCVRRLVPEYELRKLIRAPEEDAERPQHCRALYASVVTMTEEEYEEEVNGRYRDAKRSLIIAWMELCKFCGSQQPSPRIPPLMRRSARHSKSPFEAHCILRAEMYASFPTVRDQISRICERVSEAREHCESRGAHPVTYRVRLTSESPQQCAFGGVRVFIVARVPSDVLYQRFEVGVRHADAPHSLDAGDSGARHRCA